MTTRLKRLSGFQDGGVRVMSVCIPFCEYEESWCRRPGQGWHCTMVHQQFAGETLHGRIERALDAAGVDRLMERVWKRGAATCDI